MAVGRAILGNLPVEVTSFVGRRRELRTVLRLLSGARLVTLTGPGGSGKTRLALRVAADVRRAFTAGVWFVDLTELPEVHLLAVDADDEGAVAYRIAAVLGLRDEGALPSLRRLADHLAERVALLVMDNCEHLLPATSVVVATLLRSCPRLRVLVTSREPLAVTGEVIFPVPQLPAPGPDEPADPAVLTRFEAVTLFVARAQAVQPGFELTDANRATVAALCRRLEGLPLAIELAAARVRVLSPEQILERTADRFTLLNRGYRTAPHRHQTLRACVDWSFELCDVPERRLWARLSVFVGAFELDAVEGVCADEVLPADALLDVLAGLVDKSIVICDGVADGTREQARYRMLEVLREFGSDKLVEAGEDAEFRRRHRDWYLRLVGQAAMQWSSNRQAYWHVRLSWEHPNLRAALEYSLAHPGQAQAALDLAVAIPGLFWWIVGMLGEGRRWLGRALAQASAPTVARARGLLLAAHLAITQGDRAAGTPLLAEGEELARRLGGGVELAFAAFVRGVSSLHGGDPSAAITAFESTGDILAALPPGGSGLEIELRIGHLNALGLAAAAAGDRRRADACIQEVLAITEPRGEIHVRSYALWSRALSAWSDSGAEDAAPALAACLRLKQAAGLSDAYGTARCVELAAWIACARSQYQRAATLLGAGDVLWTKLGIPPAAAAGLSAGHEECERKARAGLADAVFTEAFTHGRNLADADMIAYALNDRRETPMAARSDELASLTPREGEVAALLAQGLSNKEIAGRLIVSTRTAESHVENILAKLGFTSRVQVATWFSAHQPDGPDH